MNAFDSTQRRETPHPQQQLSPPARTGMVVLFKEHFKFWLHKKSIKDQQHPPKIAAFGVVPTLVRPFFGAVVVPGCSFASGRTYCATGRGSDILRAARSCWVRISWVDPQLAGAIFLRYLRCPKGMMIIGPILDVFLKGDDKQKHYIIL